VTLRRALAVALCLLLLSLQQQALVHPISHLAGAKPQDTQLSSSKADAPCVECALLAGASAAAVAHAPAWHGDGVAHAAAFHSHRTRAADTPAWFRSRAPPLLV